LMNTREDRLRDAKLVLKGLLDEYSDKLKQAEEFLRDFEVFNQIELFEGREQVLDQTAKLQGAMPGASSAGSLLSRLTALTEKNSENEVKLQTLQAKLKNTQQQIKKEPEFSVSSFTSEPSAANKEMEARVAKAETELALLRQNRTDEHPLVQEKEAEVRELRSKQAQLSTPVIRQEQKVANPILAQLKLQESNLRTDIDALTQEQVLLIKQARELQERLKAIPGKELEKMRIQRELGILSSTYQNIRQRFEDATLTGKIENEDRQTFNTLMPATFNPEPTKPNKQFIYIMGIFLGMTVGIVLCFLREFTDTTFRNLEDASRFLDLPILGVIPEVSGPQNKRPAHRSSRHIA
jgi:polysaccharide biosynthesis transport protein